MKIHSLLAAAVMTVGAITVSMSGANATTFVWSYSDNGTNVGGGTLDANFISGDTYEIVSISGTANGQNVTGLSGYAYGPAQQIFPNSVALVNTIGFSFGLANGKALNIYEDFGSLTQPITFPVAVILIVWSDQAILTIRVCLRAVIPLSPLSFLSRSWRRRFPPPSHFSPLASAA